MGGIVLRANLGRQLPPNLGRVVMLAPPNGGTELVDLMGKLPFLQRHMGVSRGELGTDPSGLPSRLGPVTYEVGIIAGSRSLNPLFSWLIPGADDGMVAVERTKLEGMKDFLVVPHEHTFIMNRPEVIRQTLRFLEQGSFEH